MCSTKITVYQLKIPLVVSVDILFVNYLPKVAAPRNN